MKNFLKDKKIYLINCLTVICIFLLVLIINKISPFGNYILGKSDAIIQYKPMLYDFITKLREGTLLSYSFNNGLGLPTTFNYLYYLSSPFNLIAIFFKSPDGMYLSTIILKLIIGSICMTSYVKTKTNNNLIIFLATITYLFSGWFLAYYFFLTWLDVFILFPLYQKGLESLLDNKKSTLYIIALALITVSNIYLAFSVYIYTIIYFIIYELFYKKNDKKEKILKFNIITLSTLTSFLIIFAFLYLAFDIFMKSGLILGSDITANYSLKFTGFISSFFYGNTNVNSTLEGIIFPNIAINSFALINIIYYFFNKNISKKDKKYALIGLAFLVTAMFIEQVDFVFNFFHSIRGFAFRYSYIFVFLGIKMFITNLKNIDYNNKRILYTLPIIIIFFLISFKQLSYFNLILNISFILCFLVLLFLYQNNKLHNALIIILVIVETTVVAIKTIPDQIDNKLIDKEEIILNNYTKENVKYRLNYSINEDLKKNDSNNVYQKTLYGNPYDEILNENLYYNAKVIYLATSVPYKRVTRLTESMGCYSYLENYIDCRSENQIINLLFNVKSDYYLEKVFAVNKKILFMDSDVSTPVKNNLENIVSGMTNITNIYKKETLIGEEKENEYFFETDYPIYQIETKDEDGNITTIPQDFQKFSISKDKGAKEVNIYIINPEKVKDIYNYLSKNQIKYTYYNDNHLEGTINVDKDQIIYTSIPYDESWEVKIDGKVVQPTVILDSLLGIEVTPGKHEISLKYKNSYYIGPMIVSIISLIGFIVFKLKRKN